MASFLNGNHTKQHIHRVFLTFLLLRGLLKKLDTLLLWFMLQWLDTSVITLEIHIMEA
jgi:hypothetical protein